MFISYQYDTKSTLLKGKIFCMCVFNKNVKVKSLNTSNVSVLLMVIAM